MLGKTGFVFSTSAALRLAFSLQRLSLCSCLFEAVEFVTFIPSVGLQEVNHGHVHVLEHGKKQGQEGKRDTAACTTVVASASQLGRHVYAFFGHISCFCPAFAVAIV